MSIVLAFVAGFLVGLVIGSLLEKQRAPSSSAFEEKVNQMIPKETKGKVVRFCKRNKNR